MSAVAQAVARLMAQSRGETGFVLVMTEDGFAESVLVRRDDLELLLATWGETRA